MTDFELNEGEKNELQKQIDRVTPADEQRVLSEFEGKFRAIRDTLVYSKFAAVRDLATGALVLWEMLREKDYVVRWETKASIVFALGYLISPVDAIPDTIPVVGLVDDAMVVSFVLDRLRDEIADYRQWREANGREPLPA